MFNSKPPLHTELAELVAMLKHGLLIQRLCCGFVLKFGHPESLHVTPGFPKQKSKRESGILLRLLPLQGLSY